MSKNLQDSKDFETYKISTFEEATDIWSFEKNVINTNEWESFSDFSGRSTSSCSWNNDDFDMISSSKVSQSLEAIDNALYEKQQSPFISEGVFRECCEWANKFPYFRLKGERIILPVDDVFFNDKNENEASKNFENSLNFHVEGKKMALHQPDKTSKRINFKCFQDSGQAACSEKTAIDNEENIFNFSQCENMHSDVMLANLNKDEDKTSAASLNFLREKIIEKLTLNTWSKVLEILQRCGNPPKAESISEDFKLPPLVTAPIKQKEYVTLQRPKTEGTTGIEFPKLSSALSVSPKILQDRSSCKSGRLSLRSSRPTSEIYLSRRKNMFSNISANISSQKIIYPYSNTSKQLQITSNYKHIKEETDDDAISLFLPALEEDITDPIGYLKGISLQADSKIISRSNPSCVPKKTECFLPSISMNKLHPHDNLARNLFTFFGSDLKTTTNKEMPCNSKTPALHSNISASKKNMKQQEESNYKFLNENFSSLPNSSQLETKRVDDKLDTQVTLFPIVTSLTPSKEKSSTSAKRSFLYASSCQKR